MRAIHDPEDLNEHCSPLSDSDRASRTAYEWSLARASGPDETLLTASQYSRHALHPSSLQEPLEPASFRPLCIGPLSTQASPSTKGRETLDLRSAREQAASRSRRARGEGRSSSDQAAVGRTTSPLRGTPYGSLFSTPSTQRGRGLPTRHALRPTASRHVVSRWSFSERDSSSQQAWRGLGSSSQTIRRLRGLPLPPTRALKDAVSPVRSAA